MCIRDRLSGVGGQGILSIATVIGKAALKEGLYMKQAEVHGMSQRGGDAGYDEKGVILFASEAKNLVGLTDKIMPFPPGYYYKNGSFILECNIYSECQQSAERECII